VRRSAAPWGVAALVALVALVAPGAIVALILATGATRAAEPTVTEYHPQPIVGVSLVDAGSIVDGPDGALWFPEPGGVGNHVGRVTTAGSFTAFAIPGHTNGDTRIVVGPDRALWYTEWAGGDYNAVGRITTAGAADDIALPSGSAPRGIAVGPDGALWIAAYGSGSVLRLDPASRQLASFPLPPDAPHPQVVAADPGGSGVWVSTVQAGRLLHLASDGHVVTDTATPFEVSAMAVGPDRRLWLAGGSWNALATIDPTSGAIDREFPLRVAADDLVFDTFGRIWLATRNQGLTANISRFDPATGQMIGVSVPSAYGAPAAVALGSDDQVWFIESRFSADPATPNVARETVARALTGAPLIPAATTEAVPTLELATVFGVEAITPENLAASGIGLAFLYVFLVLPSTLLNRTLEANHERVGRWRFVRWFRDEGDRAGLHDGAAVGWPAALLVAAIGAAIYVVPPLRQGVAGIPAKYVELLVGVVIPVLVLVALADRVVKRSAGGAEPWSYPLGLLIAAVLAGIAALFSVGVLFAYGLVATWRPRRDVELRPEERGPIIRSAGLVILAIAIAAWLALELFRPPVGGDGDPVRGLLEGGFLCAVEFLLIGLLPVRFLAGQDLREWSVPWHAALWGAGAFLFLVFVIAPGYAASDSGDEVALTVVGGAFALLSVAFWAAMARRPATVGPVAG